MTTSRHTQTGLEVLLTVDPPNSRHTQTGLEVLLVEATATDITTIPSVITYNGITSTILQGTFINTVPANMDYSGTKSTIFSGKVIDTLPANYDYSGIPSAIRSFNPRASKSFLYFN